MVLRYGGWAVLGFWVCLGLLGACGDDGSVTDDGGSDVALDVGSDGIALPEDAGADSGPDVPVVDLALQARVDSAISALRPWQEAAWYHTVVVGMRDGDSEAYGAIGRLSDASPVSADTMYEIGSVTKTFTGLLFADAIIRGEVELETTLAEVHPERTIPTGPSGGEIQLWHLTTHTSGLPTFPDNVDLMEIGSYGPEEVFGWLSTFTLPREPGVGLEYSNLAVGLLGYSVAEQADSTYTDLLQTRVLTPMGLTETTLALVDGEPGPRDATLNPTAPLALDDVLAGAGELRSSAREMMRYARYQLHPEDLESPLRDAISASHEERFSTGSARVAHNWFFRDDDEVIWHNGATNGFHSFFAFVPSEDRAVVVLANVPNHLESTRHQILALDYLREQDPTVPVPPDVYDISDLSVLDDYVGTYDLGGLPTTVIRRGRWTFVQVEGQPAFPMFPTAEDTFALRAVMASVRFLRDDGGQVEAFELRQGGVIIAPRIDEP